VATKPRGGDKFACGKCVVEMRRPRACESARFRSLRWIIARELSFWRSWTLGGPPFIHPPGPRHARQACTSVRRSFSAIGDVFRPNNWRTNSPMAKIRLSCAKKTAHLAGHSVSMGPRVQIQPAPPYSLPISVDFGEFLQISACARDLLVRMDLENGSGGANRRITPRPIRPRFC
jgi:hypothetical protein